MAVAAACDCRDFPSPWNAEVLLARRASQALGIWTTKLAKKYEETHEKILPRDAPHSWKIVHFLVEEPNLHPQ